MSNEKLLKRANKILEAGLNSAVADEGRWRIEEMRIHIGYSEPGYGTLEGDDVIVTGNFNTCDRYDRRVNARYEVDNIPQRVGEVLEKAGIDIQWNDEWSECCDCNKLVRTSADHYGWTRSYVMHADCEIVCEECVENDPEEHLRSLEGNADSANTLNGVHPNEHGYICLGEYERGYHRGQDDDPRLVAKALEEELGLERWLFNIDRVGQFDVRFSVWVHEDELTGIDREELENLLDHRAVGPSVSEALKRAFDDADRKMRELPSEGIKYAKLNEDGTADVKNVSAEDFIEGNM